MAFQIKRKPGTVKNTFQKDGKNLAIKQVNSSARPIGQSPDVVSEEGRSQIVYDPDNVPKAPAAYVVNVRAFNSEVTGITNWVSQPDNVYIGRDMTKFVPGANGSKWGNIFGDESERKEQRVAKYEEYVRKTPHLYDSLEELKGKNLGCWCHPDPCHGHSLVKLLEEKLKKSS